MTDYPNMFAPDTDINSETNKNIKNAFNNLLKMYTKKKNIPFKTVERTGSISKTDIDNGKLYMTKRKKVDPKVIDDINLIIDDSVDKFSKNNANTIIETVNKDDKVSAINILPFLLYYFLHKVIDAHSTNTTRDKIPKSGQSHASVATMSDSVAPPSSSARALDTVSANSVVQSEQGDLEKTQKIVDTYTASKKRNDVEMQQKRANSADKTQKRVETRKKESSITGSLSSSNSSVDTEQQESKHGERDEADIQGHEAILIEEFLSGDNNDNGGKYNTIPRDDRVPENYKTPDDRMKFVKQYFVLEPSYINEITNIEWVSNNKILLTWFLNNWYQGGDKGERDKREIEDLITAYTIDPISLIDANIRSSFEIYLTSIIGKPNGSNPQKKYTDAELAEMKDTILKKCKTINLPNEEESKNAINKVKFQKKKSSTENIVTVNNDTYDKIETGSNGDCLYSSFLYGLFYNELTPPTNIGWVPSDTNHVGNLRQVIANYICDMLDKNSYMEKDYGLQDLIECYNRVMLSNGNANGWGEDTESRILSDMFKVNIGTIKPADNEKKFTYIQNGSYMDNTIENVVPEGRIIYLVNNAEYRKFGFHFQALIKQSVATNNGGQDVADGQGGDVPVGQGGDVPVGQGATVQDAATDGQGATVQDAATDGQGGDVPVGQGIEGDAAAVPVGQGATIQGADTDGQGADASNTDETNGKGVRVNNDDIIFKLNNVKEQIQTTETDAEDSKQKKVEVIQLIDKILGVAGDLDDDNSAYMLQTFYEYIEALYSTDSNDNGDAENTIQSVLQLYENGDSTIKITDNSKKTQNPADYFLKELFGYIQDSNKPEKDRNRKLNSYFKPAKVNTVTTYQVKGGTKRNKRYKRKSTKKRKPKSTKRHKSKYTKRPKYKRNSSTRKKTKRKVKQENGKN